MKTNIINKQGHIVYKSTPMRLLKCQAYLSAFRTATLLFLVAFFIGSDARADIPSSVSVDGYAATLTGSWQSGGYSTGSYVHNSVTEDPETNELGGYYIEATVTDYEDGTYYVWVNVYQYSPGVGTTYRSGWGTINPSDNSGSFGWWSGPGGSFPSLAF